MRRVQGSLRHLVENPGTEMVCGKQLDVGERKAHEKPVRHG
jgi:hypothetical protein